jgi:hypothetical protein
MWKEVIVAEFKALYRDLSGGTKEKYSKSLVRIAGSRTEIQTGVLTTETQRFKTNSEFSEMASVAVGPLRGEPTRSGGINCSTSLPNFLIYTRRYKDSAVKLQPHSLPQFWLRRFTSLALLSRGVICFTGLSALSSFHISNVPI